ncbi:MAG: BrnT family toxin [Aridibacter sp.]
MLFDWVKEKARINLRDHKVSFQEAATVFGNPLSETYDDPDHSVDEQRFIIIGHSDNGRLLFVSHSDNDETVRIISAIEVTRGERKQYEER